MLNIQNILKDSIDLFEINHKYARTGKVLILRIYEEICKNFIFLYQKKKQMNENENTSVPQ